MTFQQFIVLANRHGEVDMTADAISRRTTIPLQIIEKGISVLSGPDDGSRTPDQEGRRIVLLDQHRDWGWRIVNYEKYRKIRSEEERREYQRVLMAERRKKLAPVSNVSPCSMQYADAVSSKNISPAKTAGLNPTGEFLIFWENYPRKLGKQKGLKAWIRRGCEGRLGEVLASLKAWVEVEWTGREREYIPHAATWLNEDRWKETPQKGTGISKPSLEDQLRDWEVAHGHGSKPHAN